MKKILLTAFFLAVVLTQSACVFLTSATFNPAQSPCNARILHVPPAPGQYEEIGIVTAYSGVFVSPDAIRQAILNRTCELGGDAIYISEPSYPACTFEISRYGNLEGVLLKAKAPTANDPAPPTLQ